MVHHLDRIGQRIGDYRLLRWLGGGGFGNVYLAEQIRDHSQVAIKLLGIRLSRSEELKAFINEARMMRLKHTHIVPLLDFGISQEEIPFLVMEYVAQGTLRERYPRGAQVPLPLVVNYAQQVGSALQYAHEQGLIHRDVKPQNMLLRTDGIVLLSDFGIVAVAHSSDSLRLWQEIGGTIPYMAPEQIQGQPQAASDQYGLGVVVYEWITGQRPFEGTATEIAMQHAMKPPPSIVAQMPMLGRAVGEVVLKALAKEAGERFATVQDFTTALEQAVREAPAIFSGFMPRQSLTPAVPDVDNTLSVDSDKMLDTSILSVPDPAPGPLVDWGDALTVPVFYGREREQALLSQWVVQECCRVVSVLGMGGIGKSALVISVTRQLVVRACPFEVVIVRSLRDAPSCEALLDDCLQVLSRYALGKSQEGMYAWDGQGIGLLLEYFRRVRVLVVLDNLECLIEAGDVRGRFRPGFEGYGQLLRRVAETAHQSCLLLTSREKPAELRSLVGRYSSARSLLLAGLDTGSCKQLIKEKEVVGTEAELESLIEVYAGNPLALKIVAETIVDLFGGAVGPFLSSGMVIFGSITDLLGAQFARLSALEKRVLCWLAIMREPVTLDELSLLLVVPRPIVHVLEAVDAGYRRSLIERGKREGSFTLQAVVLEYVTVRLVEELSGEIQQGQLDKLSEYGLELAHCKEYVRQAQERLLVGPLLTDLQSTYRRRAEVEVQLLSLLGQLREEAEDVQGYGPANLVALLRLLRGHLDSLDLSRLSIRGAYLQNVEMQEASLSGAQINDCVFTEAISATWAVAVSLDGKWWAAGSMSGKVHVWDGGQSPTLRLVWQAHTDVVQALAFSPDGRMLASGSMDGTLKLWDIGARLEASPVPGLTDGTLLWTDWQNHSQCLAFSPDSRLLASGGQDGTIRLWEPQSGVILRTLISVPSSGSRKAIDSCRIPTGEEYTPNPNESSGNALRHPGSVFALAFSSDGDLLASGCCDGEIRLWERIHTVSATYVEFLCLQTNWVTSLAFAPDGRTLASAHWHEEVKLWEIPSGRLLRALPGQMEQGKRVVWSPDGRLLGSCSHDKAIWLWDVERGCYRAALVGHTADVHDIVFTPDSCRLLSSSADSTLRVWDIESHQCVRVIAGYAVSLYGLDWSPDGMYLVSGSTDGLVTVWEPGGEVAPRALHDRSRSVRQVEWSPDGRFVASCGWDMAIRLWDPVVGVCVQMLQDASTVLESVAWSPDGRWLAGGTYQGGIQVWDVVKCSLLWVGRVRLTSFSRVAWSPDGTRLVGGGSDGGVYLWEGVDSIEWGQGPVPTKLSGHQSKVLSVVWSPDGGWLASGGGSGELFVWDAASGERVRTFEGHTGVVLALAWGCCRDETCPHAGACARSDWLVSGGSDGMLRWWDIQSGECVMVQEAHQGPIRSLRVSPDGEQLASCGDDGAMRIWDLYSGGGEGEGVVPTVLRTLRRDRPYEGLNIAGIRGLNGAQKSTLRALGAIEGTAL